MARKSSALAGKKTTKGVIKHSLNLSSEENRLLMSLKNKAEAELINGPSEPYLIDMSDILRAGLYMLRLKSGKEIVELVEILEKNRRKEKVG